MLAPPGIGTVLQAFSRSGYLSTLAQTTLLRLSRSCWAFAHHVGNADDFIHSQSHLSATQQKLTTQGKPLISHAELQSPRGRQAILPCNPQQQLAPSRQQQLLSTLSVAQQALDRNAPSRVQHNSRKQHKSQRCKVQVDHAQNMVASAPQVVLERISKQTAPSSSELQVLQWPVTKSVHIATQLMLLRRLAVANMQDGPSAHKAFSEYTVQINAFLDKHPALCNPIIASIALLSLAHLTQRAETFGITLNSSVVETAHKLLDLAVAQKHMADSKSLANVFWALARLNVPPASVRPEYEASLAQAYLAAQHSHILGVSNVLWALSILKINPLKGKLLGYLIQRTEECIADPALISSQYMQCFSTTLWACGSLGLFLKPALAEHLVSRFHEGIMQGVDDPISIASMMRALTILGYAPPAQVLDDFKDSLIHSKLPLNSQTSCTIVWALAVFGRLDLAFLQFAVSQLKPTTPLQPSNKQQLYQALQLLQPKSPKDPSCYQWQQVAHFVQETWPLQLPPPGPQSAFEVGVYLTLLQMGYQAVGHHDAGDGLHAIDVALLPQKGLPVKVAVEADGPDHYLFEDCRLQASLQPATRPNGSTLFRDAMLRKQGWTLLSIPHFEWDLLNYAARPKYLAKKLHQLLQEQS